MRAFSRTERLSGRANPRIDYSPLTEQWGDPMPTTEAEMAMTRYCFAANQAVGARVLEVACGSGFGVDYLSITANFVAGGDLTWANLAEARRHVPTGQFVQLDGSRLPFRSNSFDTIVVFEALYYFNDPDRLFWECARVLRPSGVLLLSYPNPACTGFHPSPYSHTYYSAVDLESTLHRCDFSDVTIFGGFPVGAAGVRGRSLVFALALASKVHVIPKNLHGRARWKRLFYGRLEPFAGLRATAVRSGALVKLASGESSPEHRMLYARAFRPA